MRDFLVLNEDGSIKAILMGPQDVEAAANLRIALVMMLGAVRAYTTRFKITSLNRKLDGFAAGMQRLYEAFIADD